MNKTKKILFAKAQGVLQRGTVATLCIVLVTFFTAVSCEKTNALLSNTDGDTTSQDTITNDSNNKLIGIWLAQEPLIGMAPIIEFTDDFIVKQHFVFAGWGYAIEQNTLIFSDVQNDKTKTFNLSYVKDDEIVINDFMNGIETTEIKNIHFVRNTNAE
jgi:hypothetical protein